MSKKKQAPVQKPMDYNYAKDEEFGKTIATNLLDIFLLVQNQRQRREAIWQESYRAWSIDRNEIDKNYDGMANLKVPQLRKEVETMARRIYKGLLPDDYLKGDAIDGFMDEEIAITNTQAVRHYYDNVIKIKQHLYPWVKQKIILGTSPIRQYWHKQTNEMIYKKRIPYEMPNGEIRFKAQAVKEEVVLYNAPKLRAEDLFNTWVYPHNAQTPEDIEIHFWRTQVKKFDLERKSKEGTCVHFGKIEDHGKELSQDFAAATERLSQYGDSGEYKSLQGNDYFELLEVWCPLLLPGSDRPVSCVVEIINNQLCTRIQRNPYWHSSPPLDYGRFIIPPPGEFYGRGLPEAAMSLQHQLDDTMNQTMDATTLALNNITIVNPAYAPNAESFEIEPGATWWADPAAVKQFQFPDLTDTGYKAAGTLRNWISEMSDNQPQLPDPIAGKARSTGQAQMAVNEWQTDLFCFIDFLSVEALSSMAHKTHSLLQQFLDEKDIIKVSGKYAGTMINRVVTPEDLAGRYKFTWMGALQIENQAVKTQQMLNLLQIWGTLPPEAQSQVRMRWENYIIKLLRDGFLIKDVENIVETDRLVATTDPVLEEKILDCGGDIRVEKADDDSAHLQIHKAAHAKDKNILSRARRAKHILETEKQIEKKRAETNQVAMQMQLLQSMGGPEAPQGGGQQGPGNKGQIPQSTKVADMQRGMKLNTT